MDPVFAQLVKTVAAKSIPLEQVDYWFRSEDPFSARWVEGVVLKDGARVVLKEGIGELGK